MTSFENSDKNAKIIINRNRMELLTGPEFCDTRDARIKKKRKICRRSPVIYVSRNILKAEWHAQFDEKYKRLRITINFSINS